MTRVRAITQRPWHYLEWRQSLAATLVALFVSLWAGILLHGYQHADLAPAHHQHSADELPTEGEHPCDLCHITLHKFCDGPTYDLTYTSIVNHIVYHLRAAQAPLVASIVCTHERAPPSSTPKPVLL